MRLRLLLVAFVFLMLAGVASAQVAQFPTAKDTQYTLLRAANKASTTLTVALNSSGTTATVTSTSTFPTSGRVLLSNVEFVDYTSKDGTHLFGLVRAREGTTAQSHLSNGAVQMVMSADFHNILADAIIGIEGSVGGDGWGALKEPRLTTTQRNALVSPVAGWTIWNTTTAQTETYDGASWVSGLITAVTNDTNVTGGIVGHAFQLGWTGTLAKTRTLGTTVYTDQVNTFGNFVQTFQAGSNYLLVDPTDTTKKFKFDASNIATGQTRIVNIPGANSTTVQPDTGVSHQFLTAISAQGVVSGAQPAFNDISGTATAGQLPSTAVNSVVNDTNVTGSIAAQALTLGWTGTLAKTRIVPTAVYNDQANTWGNFTQTFQGSVAYTAGNVTFGAKGTNFNTDLTPAVMIHRLNDRLFIGAATDNDGRRSGFNIVKDWLETFRSGTTSAASVSVLSTQGQMAIVGASRSSDYPVPGMAPIGIAGFVINDHATNADGVYGGYYEAHMMNATPASGSSTAIGIEIDPVNHKAAFTTSAQPYAMVSNNMVTALWLAGGGGGSYASVIRNHLAIGIINNTTLFDKGIVFGSTSLSRVGSLEAGTGTGVATAIEMAQGHQIKWTKSDGSNLGIASDSLYQLTGSIGATSTDGILIQNMTAAAAGSQQWSPREHFTGQGWKTSPTAASQTVDWIAELQPVQGAANPSGNLVWSSQVNGGGYTARTYWNTQGTWGFGIDPVALTTVIPFAVQTNFSTNFAAIIRNNFPSSNTTLIIDSAPGQNSSVALAASASANVPVNKWYIGNNGSDDHFRMLNSDANGNVERLKLTQAGLLTLSGYGVGVATFDSGGNISSGVVAVAQGGTGDTGTAWTPYSPTVTSFNGTITTLGTVTGRYKQLGKTVWVQISIVITTNGTGAGYVKATLPFTAAGFAYMMAGKENAVTGKQLSGQILASGTTVDIRYYDATYPGADGVKLEVSGVYEVP